MCTNFKRLIFVSLLLLGYRPSAMAFMDSDEQQFRADLREAIARARDFQKTMDQQARERQEVARAAEVYKRERLKSDEAHERIRREFVRQRNELPDPELQREQMEQRDDEMHAREEQQMDEYRRKYVLRRNEVRALIEQDAHIDANREYGLESDLDRGL